MGMRGISSALRVNAEVAQFETVACRFVEGQPDIAMSPLGEYPNRW